MICLPKSSSPLPLVLGVALAIASVSPLAAQAERPIDLTHLKDKDAWRALEQASPGDVFIVRGRRVRAATLKEQGERVKAVALQRRRRVAAALRQGPTQLVRQVFEDQRLHEQWVGEQQEALGAQRRAELEREHAPASREVRDAREEAIRLAAQYGKARTAEERERLKRALADVAERLERLGAPIEPKPDCD